MSATATQGYANGCATRACRAPECSQERGYANGLCPKHNYRFRRYGVIELPPRLSLRERFMQYAMPEPFSGCWLWLGAIDKGGYGVLNVDGLVQRAHRLSYILFRGPINDPAIFACHCCDTRMCVNPGHIFLGTAQDNSDDAMRKGRTARGERSGGSVLTENQVTAIRALYQSGGYTYNILGAQFGVDHTAIYKIVRNKRWRHLCS